MILLLWWSTLYIAFPKCVLILIFWFWFVTIYPKCMYKRRLFSKFKVLREISSNIASFVEHPVYIIFKMSSVLILVFWFCFVTVYPKYMCKSHLFLKFLVLRKGSSFIASFVEHPVCSYFKMYRVIILVFLF